MPPFRRPARRTRWITLVAIGICTFMLGLLSGSSWDWQHVQQVEASKVEGAAGLLTSSQEQRPGRCPYPYDRHSIDQIREGQTPYLFGGIHKPKCRHCGSNSTWSNFCRFDNFLPGNPACGQDRKQWLIEGFLDREFHEILTSTPCDLFQLLRGQTIWVVGDSQSLDFSKALHCFLHEFWDLKLHNISSKEPQYAPLLKQLQSAQCGNLVGSTRICYMRADKPHTVLDLIIPILMGIGFSNDLLLLNVGLHFSPHYEIELQKIAEVFQDQGSTLPKLLWVDTPPQHFLTEFGEFPKDFGRPPHKCWYIGKYSKRDPLTLTKDHQLTTTDPKYQSVVEGGWRNIISRAVMAAADIPVLQIWNESTALWNYHRDNGAGWECTHYCFPSAPQVWVYHLLVKLRELQSV